MNLKVVLDTHKLGKLVLFLSESLVKMVLDTHYSLSWLMHHVDFDRLGAKCGLCDHWKFLISSVVYATIGKFISSFVC